MTADPDQLREVHPESAAPELTPWHERPLAMVVAGVGGVAAIGALVFAVVATSHPSPVPRLPDGTTSGSVTATSSAPRSTPVTTTRPSVVTTSDDVSNPTLPAPVPEEPSAPPSSEPATTTLQNPYATTTVPNAGAF